MSNGVIITAIICATVIAVFWMAYRNDKKGGDKHDK